MRWKALVLGGLVTLIVTVIAGLLVFLVTQEEEIIRSEKLTYQIDKQVSFDGSNNKISIGSMKFANTGNEPANNIVAKFISDNSDIIEFKIINDGDAEISEERSEDGFTIKLKIKNLLPEEIISITYLLNQKSKIEFSLRSEHSIGAAGPIYKPNKNRKSILNDFFGDFVPLLIIVIFLSLLFFKRLITNLGGRGDSRNNIGFVLLHSGLVDEAKAMLELSLNNEGAGAYALAITHPLKHWKVIRGKLDCIWSRRNSWQALNMRMQFAN